MLKKIGIALAVLVLGFVAFVATRPATFHLERSTTITAAPHVVFDQVSDFHKWNAWSPWEKLDPTMKKEYSGAPKGKGAEYHWVGNDKTGEGKMTITEVAENAKIVIRLEFIKPFAAVNTTTFTFKPAGAGNTVTWAMDGENGFVSKAMQVFMDMDTMVGKDFEKGLADLKIVSEAQSQKEAEAAAAKAKAEAEAAAARAAAAPSDGGVAPVPAPGKLIAPPK